MPKRLAIALLLISTLLAAAAVTGWRLTRMPPSWWTPPDPASAATGRLAERVEYRLVEEAHRNRPPDESWQVRIREPQLNAWLAARLPEWVAHRYGLDWPRQLGRPQVHFDDETISVACTARLEDRDRYLSASFAPRVEGDELVLELRGVSIGRLWIPGGSIDTLAARLEAVLPEAFIRDPQVRSALRLLAEQQRVVPALPLHDGRRVEVLGVSCRPGSLVLRCRTGGAASPDPPRDPVATDRGPDSPV